MNNYLWANAYWYFLHSFSCNINNNKLTNKNIYLINIFIIRLMNSIPCEKCKIDSVNYFENNMFKKIKTKDEYKLFFFKFHNYVNNKIKKPVAKLNILNKYNNISFLEYLRIIDTIIYKNKLDKQIYKFFILLQKNN